MKKTAFIVSALLILSFFIVPVSAVSAEEISTEDLDLPELETLDLSESPLGSLDALLKYSQRLISAAEELLNFIESIFEMLGMENNEDVKELLSVIDDGLEMPDLK